MNTCTDCGHTYTPTSRNHHRQKRCPLCVAVKNLGHTLTEEEENLLVGGPENYERMIKGYLADTRVVEPDEHHYTIGTVEAECV